MQEVDKVASASFVQEDFVEGGWVVEIASAGAGMEGAFCDDMCDSVAGREVPGCISIRVGARSGGCVPHSGTELI